MPMELSVELLLAMAKGMATYIPGLDRLGGRHTGGTVSARYCYSVWLRHLITAMTHGLKRHPAVVAELGPGDSLGTGVAALLTGADRLYAFDVVRYADPSQDLAVLDELVTLLSRREPIPGDGEFPEVKPRLASYAFPRELLGDGHLRSTLAPDRVHAIREALSSRRGSRTGSIQVSYFVPWTAEAVIEEGTVDMVYSQAVLEHVSDLDLTYDALRRWVRPGAWMSHQIDFRCHGLARTWNGHWTYPEPVWRVIHGRKPYLLNRASHSMHLEHLRAQGFEIVGDLATRDREGVARERLARRFRHYTDEDLRTSSALLLAVKPVRVREDRPPAPGPTYSLPR